MCMTVEWDDTEGRCQASSVGELARLLHVPVARFNIWHDFKGDATTDDWVVGGMDCLCGVDVHWHCTLVGWTCVDTGVCWEVTPNRPGLLALAFGADI